MNSAGLTLHRCSNCGLVRTEGSGQEAVYDENYYSAHDLTDSLRSGSEAGITGMRTRLMHRAYAAYLGPSSLWSRLAYLPVRNRLGGLPPAGLKGRTLLDLGCGDGSFLFLAGRHGWDCTGIEVNPAAVDAARAAGLNVLLGDLASAPLGPTKFDVVRLWHVLEHVPEPVELLGQVRARLRPDGVLVVGVPDFGSPVRRVFGPRWSGLQLPYHLHHFDRSTLRRTLEAAGFEIVRLRNRSVGTAFSSLAAWRGIFGNPLTWALALLLDDVLDLAGRGDALEVIAVSREFEPAK
jgi:SAM-dependent methyltransferase